jgi:hypothetical protein
MIEVYLRFRDASCLHVQGNMHSSISETSMKFYQTTRRSILETLIFILAAVRILNLTNLKYLCRSPFCLTYRLRYKTVLMLSNATLYLYFWICCSNIRWITARAETLGFHKVGEDFLTKWATFSFSWNLPCGVSRESQIRKNAGLSTSGETKHA